MCGASAVTSMSDSCTWRAIRSRSGSMPTAQCSRNDSQASASRRIERRTLWTISGLKTFSSKLPEAPPIATATSLPITWAQTIVIASHCVGLTLPGMMLLPGSFSGMRSSPMPARGPEASQRTSLAILVSEVASVLSAPLAKTSASCEASAWNLFGALVNGMPVSFASCADDPLAESRVRVEPGADGGAADRELVERRQGRADAPRHGRAGDPARDLLPERQRRRVLQVRAADLDDVGERARLAVQHVAQRRDRGNQARDDLADRGQVHGRRERVVGRLRAVDVVVRVHRLLRAHLPPSELDRAVADDLVGVHVGLRPAAGLPDDEREMRVERAGDHLVGGLRRWRARSSFGSRPSSAFTSAQAFLSRPKARIISGGSVPRRS